MIYLGADHGGFELKKKIKKWLDEWGYEYEDLGAHVNDPDDDYPQFAFAVAEAVAEDPEEHKGILGCRSAGGVVIAANKVKGVRAVASLNEESAEHSREHNDANVVGLSGDWLTDEEAKAILETWLDTSASPEKRHVRRRTQIAQYEEDNFSRS